MRHLCDAFPTLPDRSQFNRLVRTHLDLIEAVALHLAEMMEAQRCPYEALDRALLCPSETQSDGVVDGLPAAPTSDGAIAWDGTRASVSLWPSTLWSHNWLWLLCRFGHRPASGRDLLRRAALAKAKVGERGSCFVGTLCVADKGFEGTENHKRWLECYEAQVIHPPKRNSRRPCSKRLSPHSAPTSGYIRDYS